MIKPLSRSAFLRYSVFADNLIADLQKSYAQNFEPDDKREQAMLRKYYDHRQAFSSLSSPIDGHAVLACDARTQKEYLDSMSSSLMTLLKLFGHTELVAGDFLCNPLSAFPFQNFSKRNKLKRLLKGGLAGSAIICAVEDVSEVLSLFYFNQVYDRYSAVFITLSENIPLALLLCDDGNFHLQYHAADGEEIKAAAEEAGFCVGDIDLCWSHSICVLP